MSEPRTADGMTNEAAERLRNLIDSLLVPNRPPTVRRDYAQDVVDEALAAERRATVERIRAALADAHVAWPYFGVTAYVALEDVTAILDAEAAR